MAYISKNSFTYKANRFRSNFHLRVVTYKNSFCQYFSLRFYTFQDTDSRKHKNKGIIYKGITYKGFPKSSMYRKNVIQYIPDN